jgi:hypothetical protein
VYRWTNGSLSVIADSTTVVPGRTETFTSFGSPVIRGGQIAFRGLGRSSDGIYLAEAGALATVGEVGGPAPDGAGTLGGVSSPTLWGNEVWFHAAYTSGGQALLRHRDGTLLTVVRTGNAGPGGSGRTFSSFGRPHAGGGEVAFLGDTPDRMEGVYRTSGDGLVRVVGLLQSVPDDSSDSFWGIGGLTDYDGTDTAFVGYEQGHDRYSIWTESGGRYVRRASGRDPAPGGAGVLLPFDEETYVSSDEGHIAFNARTSLSGPWSIFTDLGGSMTKLIGPGDVLRGRTVNWVQMGADALDGQSIAFFAEFTDGSDGVYLATVPEPVGVWMLGGVALLRRRRRLLESGAE